MSTFDAFSIDKKTFKNTWTRSLKIVLPLNFKLFRSKNVAKWLWRYLCECWMSECDNKIFALEILIRVIQTVDDCQGEGTKTRLGLSDLKTNIFVKRETFLQINFWI